VAKEMQRENITIPLLIGGATTSKIHTAVKIDPNYSGPVVYVRDASKVAGVLSELLSSENKDPFVERTKKHYSEIREEYLTSKAEINYISLRMARDNKLSADWQEVTFFRPEFLGNKYFIDQPLDQLIPFIDWTFFFHSWKITGKFPAIFEDPIKGVEAKKLFEDAQKMLSRILKEKMLRANAVLGFFPANTIGDDVVLFKDDTRKEELANFACSEISNSRKKELPTYAYPIILPPWGLMIILALLLSQPVWILKNG
jgi:5-methyltetrahydrofolate--homocysteine methyltransferase